MARLTNEELENIKQKYNVDRLYSWSKINTFMTSPFEYYLKYVLHKKEDHDNCAYAPLGGISHSIIERYYGNEIEYEDMIKEFEDGWMTAIEIAELRFDRTDEEKNNNIKEKYKYDLEHFFRNHIPIKTDIVLEKFIPTQIGGYVLQGYADAITKTLDEFYDIIDWKSSTKYSGKTLEEKSGQLCVYALGLIGMGIPIEKIRICFNFLKYVTIQYEQANGKIKTRDVERCKIGESLQSNCKTWLKKLGYENESDDYLKLLLDTNDIKCLPEDVQEKYVMSDCYVYQPLTRELLNKWVEEIITTIQDIELREKDFEQTKSDKCFWDTDESVKKESYYFANLCGYSPNLHLPYKAYLDKLEASKNGSDLFGGLIGSESVSTSSTNINNKNDDLDLSWLDQIV